MATDKRESGWKRALRRYDRLGHSLETSVTPWVVIIGIAFVASVIYVAWCLITGEPILLDPSMPR